MSRPIDYSKWDRFDDDDDDEVKSSSDHSEDADEDVDIGGVATQDRKPHVTRLDHPSAVTIGPNGLEVKYPEKATASPFMQEAPKFVTSSASQAVTRLQPSKTDRQRDAEADITDDLEDDLLLSKLSRSGQKVSSTSGVSASAPYLWSQTRDTVTLSIHLRNPLTRGSQIKDFRVTKLVEVSDCANEGSARLAFSVPADGEYSFLLRYPVKCDEERIEGCWNLHTLVSKQQKLMIVQLDKEDFANGVYLWWDRACIGEPPIDTTKLEGRTQQSVEAQRKWSTEWDLAHKEFRRRMMEKETKKTNINCDE